MASVKMSTLCGGVQGDWQGGLKFIQTSPLTKERREKQGGQQSIIYGSSMGDTDHSDNFGNSSTAPGGNNNFRHSHLFLLCLLGELMRG